jgi:hypothetical protein
VSGRKMASTAKSAGSRAVALSDAVSASAGAVEKVTPLVTRQPACRMRTAPPRQPGLAPKALSKVESLTIEKIATWLLDGLLMGGTPA